MAPDRDGIDDAGMRLCHAPRAALVVALALVTASGCSPGAGGLDKDRRDNPPSDLAATWSTLGDAKIGMSVEQVEDALGLVFGEIEVANDAGDCGITQTEDGSIGLVVTEPGGVQVFVVAVEGVPFVSSAPEPVGVGSSEAEVRSAFPRWVASDEETSLADGRRLVVSPAELPGQALLMELDPGGSVAQYRVGADGYALHVDYCTTPF